MSSLSIKEVTRSLVQLNEIHEEMLELGEQKKSVLVNNQVNDLSAIMQQESKLIKQVSEQEKLWVQRATAFLVEKGIKPESSMTMSELIKLVFNADDKQALIEAQQQLLDTIEKLKETNALNQQLIEQSLEFIDYTLDVMTESPEEGMFYHNPADKSNKNKSTRIFDTKA